MNLKIEELIERIDELKTKYILAKLKGSIQSIFPGLLFYSTRLSQDELLKEGRVYINHASNQILAAICLAKNIPYIRVVKRCRRTRFGMKYLFSGIVVDLAGAIKIYEFFLRRYYQDQAKQDKRLGDLFKKAGQMIQSKKQPKLLECRL